MHVHWKHASASTNTCACVSASASSQRPQPRLDLDTYTFLSHLVRFREHRNLPLCIFGRHLSGHMCQDSSASRPCPIFRNTFATEVMDMCITPQPYTCMQRNAHRVVDNVLCIMPKSCRGRPDTNTNQISASLDSKDYQKKMKTLVGLCRHCTGVAHAR